MSKPDLRMVVCNATHPQSLPGGRFVAVGETADDVDITHPHNKALIDAGVLTVVDQRKTRGRKASTDKQEEAAT